MDENVIAPVEVEVEPIAIENEVVETTNETVVEKPWNKEKKVPESIPYQRFSEVNSKYREEQTAREKAEARIRELEEQINKPVEPKVVESSGDKEYDNLLEEARKYGIEPPDIDQFETMADFNRAERKFQGQLAEIKAEIKFNQLREQETTHAELQRVNNDFMAKAETVREKIPDLNEAFNYFRQYSSMVPPEIQKAISSHPNGPELLYRIAGDENTLIKMVNHPQNPYYDPIEAQIFIRTFKSSLDNPVDNGNTNVSAKEPVIPKSIKGGTGKIDPYSAKSMAEYRASRKK